MRPGFLTVELVTPVLAVSVSVTEAGGGDTEAGVTVCEAPGVAVTVGPLVRPVSAVSGVITESSTGDAATVSTAPLPHPAPPALLLVLTVWALSLSITPLCQGNTGTVRTEEPLRPADLGSVLTASLVTSVPAVQLSVTNLGCIDTLSVPG